MVGMYVRRKIKNSSLHPAFLVLTGANIHKICDIDGIFSKKVAGLMKKRYLCTPKQMYFQI